MSKDLQTLPPGELLIFQSEDGLTRIQVHLIEKTVWLSQKQIADLYQVSVKTANEHLTNIYNELELTPEATIRKFRIVQHEGSREVERLVDHYNLEAILAVGYRVRSHRGTQFRRWATQHLNEYLVKGFVMDDERLKEMGGGDYFEELLNRIRDIRSSERLFYQKITDIYATSIDYDPNAQITQDFYKTVQNKLHWAIHGHTAAELVMKRADSNKPHMGLTSWKNSPKGKIRKSDVTVAKNYLSQDELQELNLAVSAYLDIAELQAKSRKPMSMVDWIKKLDEFLKLTDKDILTNAGKRSHQAAVDYAEKEYEKYLDKMRVIEAKAVVSDFDKLVEETKEVAKISAPKKSKAKGRKK